MIDFTPLSPEATEAERNDRFNALMRAVEPFSRIKGQNGVSVHLSEGNVVIEVNTKEIAGIVESSSGATGNDSGGGTSGTGTTTGGATTDPLDPGEEFIPGDSNTPGASATYEERSIGGTATLVGFSEFTDPSTPAKKYTVKTLSGNVSTAVYTDSACTTRLTIDHPIYTVTLADPSGGTCTLSVQDIAADYPHTSKRAINFRYQGCKTGGTEGWAGSSGGGQPTSTDTLFVPGPVYNDTDQVSYAYGPASFPLDVAIWRTRYLDDGTHYIPGGTGTLQLLGSMPASENIDYAGTAPASGTLSGTTINSTSGELETINASSLASVDDAITRLGSGCFSAAVDTKTTHSLPAGSTAVQIGSLSLWRKTTSSSLVDTLSAEDTEADAITRLFAGSTWSSWASASVPASTATYTARTTGFSFDYTNREFRATYAGLSANWPFKVRVRIVQINIATGAPNTAFTYNYNIVSDGSGAATWTVPVIPVTPGYNYRVQSITHTY